MQTYIAAYKGPASGLFNAIFHKGVCLVTASKYSHCELVIDGVAYSASARDGGVRSKLIDFNSGKWDLYPVTVDKDYVLSFFKETEDDPYDYLGLGYFLTGIAMGSLGKWFCSEWCAKAMKKANPHTYHIQKLVDEL